MTLYELLKSENEIKDKDIYNYYISSPISLDDEAIIYVKIEYENETQEFELDLSTCKIKKLQTRR